MTQYNPCPEPSFDEDPSIPVNDETSVSAVYYLEQGNRHYYHFQTRATKRDLDAAIRHYQRALEAEPSLSQAYIKLASSLWDRGDINLDGAINYCHLALTYEPNHPEGHLFLGYFLKKGGRLEEAIGQFKLALAQAPYRSPKARMALGISLINRAAASMSMPMGERLGVAGQGVGHFVLGTMLLPADRETFGQLSQALTTDIKIQGLLGMAQAMGMMGFQSKKRALYEWAGRVMPTEGIFFHLLGDHYRDDGEVETAIYFYNRALELDPESVALHKKLASAYEQCNDRENAARSLERVVSEEPQDYDTLYALAQIYMENKEYIRALYYFKEAVRLEPSNPYVHSNMAYVLFKMEDFDGAVEEYRLAIGYGKDPIWTATVAQTLGTIYYQVHKDIEAAIAVFTLASELDPTNLECLTMLAELYFEQGNMQGALDIYKIIERCDPENPDCHNYVGYLLWQMDRNDEAIESYSNALRCDPDNYIAYNNLGVIYLDEHYNAQEAHQMFTKALEYKPDYTLAAFNLGRSEELLGNIAEAAKSYSTALELNVLNPEMTCEEIQDRIEELFKAQ